MSNYKIKTKIFLPIIVLLITGSLINNYFVNSNMNNLLNINTQKSLLMLSDSIFITLRNAMNTGDMNIIKNAENDSRKNIDGLKSLKVYKSEETIKIYSPQESYTKDENALEAFNKKQIVTKNYDNSFRIYRPMIATNDCISCHYNNKLGDVIGVIDIEFDLSYFKELINKTFFLQILITFFIIIITLVTLYIILKKALTPLTILKNGLDNFFNFLRNETNIIEPIYVKNNDEIGLIINDINSNIEKLVEIKKDKKVLEEIDEIIEKVKNGFYWYDIKGNSKDPLIQDLVNKLNTMLSETNTKIEIIVNALMAYGESKFDYEFKEEDLKNMNGIFGSLVCSTRLLGNNVSELLSMILNTGEKLDKDIETLSLSSQNLSKAAQEQATSLEETAAALEEITATIQNNTLNVEKMGLIANNLSKSSNEGKDLANQTINSMQEINNQVNLINDAITIIDQIAFQTNILSLNAAVEAATAGEAGKGFAVVAGEVRLLANKSQEAAKNIKDLVANASQKTSDGKKISEKMIRGYNSLNSEISETIKIIEEVSFASKEQEAGIVQINDAVASLDQTTQQNAMTSSHIADLAQEVADLSNSLVVAANRSSFKKQARKQVCDVNLVYQLGKLKNDHIIFKQNNFKNLNSYKSWKVTDHNMCNLGKWIKEQEQENKIFTKTNNWINLKDAHEEVHNGVQEYIDKSSQKIENNILEKISHNIEISTIKVFDTLNQVKIDNCINGEVNEKK